MKISFNPSNSNKNILDLIKNNKDIIFDLKGHSIFARGVEFKGTDTNTWRDIKINNVSIGSHTLDLRNGSNTTLTNTNGVVTINSTWRPVVDNLTSDSTTSSLSAKQGKVLKALIDGKSNSDHNHDGRYVRYYAVTTLDCNNLAAGLTSARISATNAAHTNHSAYLYISDVGTPFQIQIPDSSIPYIYKRYYGSGKWSGWFKLNAGYADSAGSVAWANVTGKPSSYTPSAHTHAWNSLTHSSTTENQAILTNGKANGWKLQTLNIARWDNAANNAHSHANKSVLDGITSALVNSWNTAYNFVSNITGTDTDKVINKWEEIVNFLAGITEDNKLNTLLNSKLSVYELANNTNVGTIKNNGIYYSTTDASSGTLTNSPFNTGFALINMTSYDGGDDLRRSRLAFNAYGEIKVSDDRDQANTAETWYNVLTSKNSGISGSTIKLNGTSITVYSSGTADGRYVKKSGDTMSGVLTIDTTNFGALTIKRNDDANGASIQFRGKSSVYGYIGLNNSTKDKQFLRWSSDTSRMYTILDTSSTYISNGKGVINGTTITQVDNATNSTNSTNARKLVNWYSARPTSLNAQFGDGSLRIFYATSSTTEGKPAEDSHILHLAWDNTGGYDAQLAVHARSGKVSTRAQNAGTWQPWKTLAFTTDIPTSLKNPYSFNVFGVVYDGSAAKTVTTSNFISQVSEGTSTITDGTMLITSYATNNGFADTNAVNVPYKRKAIHLWEYIKAKTDSLYATKVHNHDGIYVRAFRTSNDNIDSDWGQSFKTFDPVPLGTPPEQNPNISLLSIGENFNRRKQLAFIWNNDNIYYRRRIDSSFTNWRRLAFVDQIPTSLKNPHALTISLNGTSQGPYDGSAAKNINITPGSIGAAISNHNHDGRYVYNYGGTQMNGASIDKNALGMTTTSGISGDWWHILQAAWNGEYRWNSQIAFPTQNRNGMYYRSGLDDNTKWGSWVKLLDVNNYSSTLDSRYYTESEVNSLLSKKLNTSDFNWTNLPGKLVAGNEFNIVNAGFNAEMQFNWLPINNRNSTATVRGYHFGNGAKGYASVQASGFIKTGSSSSYVLLGDGGHKLEGALNVANADTVDGYHYDAFTYKRYIGYNRNGPYNIKVFSMNTSSLTWGAYYLIFDIFSSGYFDNRVYFGRYEVSLGHWNNTDKNPTVYSRWIFKTNSAYDCVHVVKDLSNYKVDVYIENNLWDCSMGLSIIAIDGFKMVSSNSWVNLPSASSNIQIINTTYLSFIGNSSSATKLQTARKLWGQSFDGTADVSGTLSGVANIQFSANNAYDIGSDAAASRYIYTHWLGARSGRKLELGANNSGFGQGLCIDTNLNVGIGTNAPAYKLHVNGTFRATNSTVSDLFVNTGDATLKIYTGITAGAQNDGNICFQTSIDATDGQSHAYPTEFQNRCNIVLQPRGGQVYIGTNPGIGNTTYKLYVNSKIFSNGGFVKNGSSDSYVLLGGGGHKAISDFAISTHTHTVFKNNLMIKGTNGISDSASIHLGIGDSDTGFKWISDGVCQIYANNVAVGQWTSGGMNWFKNPTVNGNKVWNAGNDGSGSGLDADTLDGEHAASFVKMKQFRFGQYKKGFWTKILTITINSTSDLQPVIAFNWIPSECAREVWAEFTINWRSNSPIFYAIWKGTAVRTLTCVNSSGNIWNVWVQGDKNSYDPFGEVQVTYAHNISSYNGGSLGYSDSDPGGTRCTLGGYVNYARSTGNADTVDGQHASAFSYKSWWHWYGKDGQPNWLWGGNNENDYYVYNPSNFRVAYAASAGNADTLDGYPANGSNDRPYGHIPTIESDGVMEVGRYIDFHNDNNGKHDFSTRLQSTGNYGNEVNLPSASGTLALINDVNNYYWANVKISTSSSTTTSPTVHTLTSTRVCAGHNPGIDNSISCSNWFRSSGNTGWYNTTYQGGWYMSDTSWIRAHNGVGIYTSGQIYSSSSIRMSNILLGYTDEINNSANGGIHLNYRNSGNVSLCYGGGNVGIGTITPSYKLDVNGQMRASGFHHASVNSDNYILLAGGGYKSFGGDDSTPIFLGCLDLYRGDDGTISSSFYCLGYSVPFTYTRGGNYCKIVIPDTTRLSFYTTAAIASVNYSGGGMDTWVGEHRGDGAWWLHCYAFGWNEVRVKGFRLANGNNDSWWGGNPLYSGNGGANKITVCIFGHVKYK